MPLDPSIPLQSKAPDLNPLATLLQVGQLKYLQQNSNRLQMETAASQAVGQAIQRNTGPDGKVNLLGVQSDLAKDPNAVFGLQGATGTNLSQQGQQLVNTGQQITNDTGAQALAEKRGEAVAKAGVSLLTNPKATGADYMSTLSDLHKNGIIDDKTYIDSIDHVTPHLNNPAQLKEIVRGTLAKLPDAIQATYVKPVLGEFSNGGATQFTARDPLNGDTQIVGSAENTLPIDQRETVGVDGNGNPVVTTKDAHGTVTNVKGAPVQGQSTVPPLVIPPTETKDSYAALQAGRAQTNAAAGQVQQQHFNNRSIIDILDKEHLVNPTGSNSEWLTKVSSTIGLPVSGKFAEDANQINHYLALQKQANEKAMGVNTDAGRATAGAASGTTTMDPVSLRKAVAINDASAAGLASYNEGQEAAVQKGGIPALRPFQNAWSKYYDVNAMRLVNADKNGDKKEIQDVVNSLGGPKSAKFQQMRQNAMMLEQLKHGIIPNGGQ